MNRDAAEYTEASETPDMAESIDTLSDHIAEIVCEEWPASVGNRKPIIAITERVVTRLLRERRLGAEYDTGMISGREALTKSLQLIIDSPQPRLMARAVDLALQTGVQLGISETAIADMEGVTRASVSLYVLACKDAVLGDSVEVPWLKSAEARKSYSEKRSGKKGGKQEWEFKPTTHMT
jgi:hypothetical protein